MFAPSIDLVALVNVVADLLAASVFHAATFIVATDRHGNGDAQALHAAIEAWALGNGAAWMRLGVVQGSQRAERFWSSRGYLPVRAYPNIQIGAKSVTVQTMVKSLRGEVLESYFTLVPKDQSEPRVAL